MQNGMQGRIKERMQGVIMEGMQGSKYGSMEEKMQYGKRYLNFYNNERGNNNEK